MARFLRVAMPDGSLWDVPLDMIARSRAEHYAHEFGGDIERSLAEDTLPLFASDNYSIKDWASNDTNWSDVSARAVMVKPADAAYFDEGWANGEKTIVEKEHR